ncbi:jg18437 [Pararge aegeria aegeria]|uniref:Jg18437 protein n=1 Tax=Pararge aegeria aegeria TaxID=348720 RepID=A0A8S4SAA7_9NEOP|nr:jg18437 [Pararge aegeria aegeria]
MNKKELTDIIITRHDFRHVESTGACGYRCNVGVAEGQPRSCEQTGDQPSAAPHVPIATSCHCENRITTHYLENQIKEIT